ncbi:MAG: hypothetical protein HYW04_09690, partial [Deltaproteobacteria bacterium]|nr:hypothetical protein [Deltaproteobacteria bacterium]
RISVLRRANPEQCLCGCGMTLAQCINTDRACPIRPHHIRRAQQLVEIAKLSP